MTCFQFPNCAAVPDPLLYGPVACNNIFFILTPAFQSKPESLTYIQKNGIRAGLKLRFSSYVTLGLNVGAWRSLEAHLNGVQGVGGSNPLAPTIKFNELSGLSHFADPLNVWFLRRLSGLGHQMTAPPKKRFVI